VTRHCLSWSDSVGAGPGRAALANPDTGTLGDHADGAQLSEVTGGLDEVAVAASEE
jgi:hypothetical protein